MTLLHDLRYGLRNLRKSPGFAATAVVTMALGIGVTTAVFSVCDAMLWKPVPIPHLDSLITILQIDRENPYEYGGLTPADLEDISRQSTSIGPVASWQDGLANVAGSVGEPERVIQYLVSDNFFDVVGVQPAIGRGFRPGENVPGRELVVVLSDALWKRRFGGDPSIVGKKIRLDDEDYLVTGIAPPKFNFPKAGEVWTPYAITTEFRTSRRFSTLVAVAHLQPGHTIEQFAAELGVIGNRLATQYPDTNRLRRFMTWSGHRFLIGEFNRLYAEMLFYAVLFVLLIACVNVANLQFARATGRTREVALRTALGAGRGRIIAQLVTESVILSLAGSVLGLLVAAWGIEMIRAGMPPEVERYVVGWSTMGLDLRAMAFTILAALVSGVLAGLAPAWQSSRPDLVRALKEGGRTSAGRGRHRLRGVLVAAEVALAVVLLVGASLMARGFGAMVNAATAVEPATLLTLRLVITEKKYAEPYARRAFYSDVLAKAAVIPGVRSAAGVTALPYSDHSSGRAYVIEGRPADPQRPVLGMYQAVTAGYFDTLHIPLRAGRLLDSRDGSDAPRVAVISQEMARRFWPGEPAPIGKHIRINEKSSWMTIVGVAGDLMQNTFDRAPRAALYVPYDQDPQLGMDIAFRTTGDPRRYGTAVLGAVRAADPEQPVTGLFPMEVLIHNQALGLIYVAVLMGVFGALALVLSCVGVYGVMAYLVQEQTQEIGIRMALGAPRELVLGMILRRGLITAGIGMAAGLILAAMFARLLQNLIWGVPANDAVSFVAIPLTLIASAALAILIPARRATRIDPVVALRYD